MDIYIPERQNLKIALVEPVIPPNVGAVSRLCACIGASLYIVGKIGFEENHPKRKRAGLDYWDKVEKIYIPSTEEFFEMFPEENMFLFSTKVGKSLYDAKFKEGDILIFGSETKGLDPKWLNKYKERSFRIPMIKDIRSLNLANSSAIAAYEAIRQIHFNY